MSYAPFPHYENCTWCKHRRSFGRKPEIELCGLDQHRIPHPKSPGRFCEKFQKEGCACPKCNTDIPDGINS